MLFVAAKVFPLALLLQRHPEAKKRVQAMVWEMDQFCSIGALLFTSSLLI